MANLILPSFLARQLIDEIKNGENIRNFHQESSNRFFLLVTGGESVNSSLIPGLDLTLIFVSFENLEKSFKSLVIRGKTKTKSITGVANCESVISS